MLEQPLGRLHATPAVFKRYPHVLSGSRDRNAQPPLPACVHRAQAVLGPHPPGLWPEDVDLLHEIWLTLSQSGDLGSRLHHSDVVGAALRRMQKEPTNGREEVIDEIRRDMPRE